MNNKKQGNKPLFAEVKLTDDELKLSSCGGKLRLRFLKVVYPNNVTSCGWLGIG